MKYPSYGIHWFRRDLRVAGNAALQRCWKENQGRVVGIFAVDPIFLSRPDFSHARFAFFLKTLSCLKDELRTLGSDLLVLDHGPDQAFTRILDLLRASPSGLPRCFSFNRDYEPFARVRDARIIDLLERGYGIEAVSERDHLLIEPDELVKAPKQPGSFYQVFTPFRKRWEAMLASAPIQDRIRAQKAGLAYLTRASSGKPDSGMFCLTWKELLGRERLPEDKLEEITAKNAPHVTIPLPESGSSIAHRELRKFAQERLADYDVARDFPGQPGTSRLSIYLKNGSLTVPQILAELGSSDLGQYRTELIWREFYYHILFHRPNVEKKAFLEKYETIAWENREEFFAAWKEGRTGFPIVDAGMRQLNQTGWMHNRVRMIVASFLTKDLLIDWKWGEKYFMEKLLDGDLAPNNGGWQWAASTGCDPQPYFRIFNPALQSKRFDPEGAYIRAWVPELRGLSSKEIHEPSKTKGLASLRYPAPIVDHAVQSKKAIALYKRSG